jgi:NADPH2:quinone reductase
VLAILLSEFGGPEVLVAADMPDPVPAPGQVLIDVAFANITFVETQFRATGAGPFEPRLPMIPGNGVGGVVAAAGSPADAWLVGRRVVAGLQGSGGYAERVVVDAARAIEIPKALEIDTAVALVADGRTAVMMTRLAAPRAGERVLVEAAAGGVGILLVQLATAASARVVAAAGGEAKLAIARDLGAELAVDYTDPAWADRVRAAVGGVDVVLDGVGGAVARAAFGLLDRGGRMLSFGLASGTWADVSDEEARRRGVTLLRSPRATPAELRAYTETALAEAAAGRLEPVIGQRFPLARAADAHAAIESRATIGKTLLVVGQR